MQSFFALVSRQAPLSDDDVRRFEDAVCAASPIARQITHRRSARSRSGTAAFVCFTNEPELNLWEGADGTLAFASGYTSAGKQLAAGRADATLRALVAELPGRFCAAVFDPERDRVAAANSAVRVDPIFVGSNDAYECAGTQASAVSAVLGDGGDRYDVPGLFTLINAGFFGTDATAFEGVSCLPASSVWVAGAGRAAIDRAPLALLKVRPESAGRRHAGRLAELFAGAIGEMRAGDAPMAIGVTGGKDSRLLLAGALRAGIDVACSTKAHGAWNAADVYVAKLLTERLGLEHRVIAADARAAQSPGEITVDYLRRAAVNLRATDCGLYAYDMVRGPLKAYAPVGGMSGLGGEILRGGYAEKRTVDTIARVVDIARGQFSKSRSLFRDDVVDRYDAFFDAWLADFEGVAPPDILDCLYAEFRCGRWIAATSRSTAARNFSGQPYLDNRMARAMLATRADDKTSGRLQYRLLRALSRAAADLPLANDFWPGTSERRKAAIRKRHPDAFTPPRKAARATDWRRSFPPALADHIARYTVTDGRVDLLRDAVEPDAVSALLTGGPAALGREPRVVHGLYTACVIVSGDWRRSPSVTEPLTFGVEGLRE